DLPRPPTRLAAEDVALESKTVSGVVDMKRRAGAVVRPRRRLAARELAPGSAAARVPARLQRQAVLNLGDHSTQRVTFALYGRLAAVLDDGRLEEPPELVPSVFLRTVRGRLLEYVAERIVRVLAPGAVRELEAVQLRRFGIRVLEGAPVEPALLDDPPR